ncbi:MAG: ribosomal-processing cysteine protease Prp [Spirochaetota bacterium]
MIEVSLFSENALYIGLQVSGHAPTTYGAKGQNILCAAVSVLVQTLHLHFTKKGLIDRDRVTKGFLEFSLLSTDRLTQESFELLLTGIADLQLQYPEEIKIHK